MGTNEKWGQITVTSPVLMNTSYYSGWAWTNSNLASIAIEILAGSGSPNPFNYMRPVSASPLDSLQPNPQEDMTVAGVPSTFAAGGWFRFSYVNADFGTVDQQPYVVTISPDPNVQIAFSRADQGNGTSILNVHITNPPGFNSDDSITDLPADVSMLGDRRFQLVCENPAVDDSNWQNSIQLFGNEYFDLAGNATPEVRPLLNKVRRQYRAGRRRPTGLPATSISVPLVSVPSVFTPPFPRQESTLRYQGRAAEFASAGRGEVPGWISLCRTFTAIGCMTRVGRECSFSIPRY